jgi:hypothetical protein
MPQARVLHTSLNVALSQLGQVEPGREMLALAAEQHRARFLWYGAEESLDAEHGRVVERVPLFWTIEPQNYDVAVEIGREGFWQVYAHLFAPRRRSLDFINIQLYRQRKSLAARDREDAVDPVDGRVARLEPHRGAEII